MPHRITVATILAAARLPTIAVAGPKPIDPMGPTTTMSRGPCPDSPCTSRTRPPSISRRSHGGVAPGYGPGTNADHLKSAGGNERGYEGRVPAIGSTTPGSPPPGSSIGSWSSGSATRDCPTYRLSVCSIEFHDRPVGRRTRGSDHNWAACGHIRR